MQLTKIVLDTNALLRCISRRSSYSIVVEKLFENKYELSVTTDILLEYEEKITEIFSRETSEFLIGAFMLLTNVKKVDVHFHLNLIPQDTDDNKFADCAFASNAHFIVSDDKHFKELKTVGFPQLTVISLEEFTSLLSTDFLLVN
jgi:putative PIN family toxin of toxin-antitoxin system